MRRQLAKQTRRARKAFDRYQVLRLAIDLRHDPFVAENPAAKREGVERTSVPHRMETAVQGQVLCGLKREVVPNGFDCKW